MNYLNQKTGIKRAPRVRKAEYFKIAGSGTSAPNMLIASGRQRSNTVKLPRNLKITTSPENVSLILTRIRALVYLKKKQQRENG